MTDEEYNDQLDATMREVSNLHLAGAIKAIGVVIIKEDGDARTFLHHEEGGSFPLLAGVTLLQHSMVDMLKRRT